MVYLSICSCFPFSCVLFSYKSNIDLDQIINVVMFFNVIFIMINIIREITNQNRKKKEEITAIDVNCSYIVLL